MQQTNGTRQQHGFACEECRRRKARCDRVRPRCGSCDENGVQQCVIISKRPQRGPKKGQLDMMRTRIAMLEQQLEKQAGGGMDQSSESPRRAEDGLQAVTMPGPLITGFDQNLQPDMNIFSDSWTAPLTGLPQLLPSWPSTTKLVDPNPAGVSTEKFGFDSELTSPGGTAPMNMVLDEDIGLGNVTPMSPADSEISHLMLSDLDDVYFDRAHNICPMIHQRRYFSWARESTPSPSRTCLRSAMRTLAAAIFPPYRNLAVVLYAETCRLLEESRQAGTSEASWGSAEDKTQTEYIQAWLLVAHYECLRMSEGQAMLTAGRAFRLVQMARLHDLDESKKAKEDFGESFSETEERRRTFWVAYILDSFLCWRNEWPLTLYEDMVGTRLPVPEAHFQSNKTVRTASLAEALSTTESSESLQLSAFAECAVLATLHSRCMAHRRAVARQRNLESTITPSAGGFWARTEWLAGAVLAVDRRVRLLACWGEGGERASLDRGDGDTPTLAVERDPMLFFAHMLAHSAVVCIGAIARVTPPALCHSAPVHEQRALRAAADMARLVRGLPSLNCFKAHLFLSNPLAIAIAFLQAQPAPTQDSHTACKTLLNLLRDLRHVNNTALDVCAPHIV